MALVPVLKESRSETRSRRASTLFKRTIDIGKMSTDNNKGVKFSV